MAYDVQTLMTNLMANPEVAAIGVLVGFLLAKALDWKKNRGSGFGGGGFP